MKSFLQYIGNSSTHTPTWGGVSTSRQLAPVTRDPNTTEWEIQLRRMGEGAAKGAEIRKRLRGRPPTPEEAYQDYLSSQIAEEYDGGPETETPSDPAEWLPAYHRDWCRDNPGHEDCAQYKELRAANTQDLKELPGAAGEAAHKRLHSVIGKLLKKSGA